MKASKHYKTVALLAFLTATSAYADLEDCRIPTLDEKTQLDLCRLNAECRSGVSAQKSCASIVDAIKRFFSTEKTPTTVTLRRGANSGSALFQNAINQADEDARNPGAREAREQAARARAESAHALQQEQARQSAQTASEGLAVLGQVLGAIGQYQQDKADRTQAQYQEQQRRLQAQQEQQRSIQEQQRRLQEQQNRAYEAEAARAEAFNREADLAARQLANQRSSVARNTPSETVVGAQIINTIGSAQPQRSASDPPPMGHIPMGGGGIRPFPNPSGDRLAQENRDRERAHKENVKRHEEEVRRNQAARAEAQRQREAEQKRQWQEKSQAKAAERSNLEGKIRAAIFRSDSVVHYLNNQTCQYIFTNTTAYWVTVVWDYTVTIEDKSGKRSHQPQWAAELPPGQTIPAGVFSVWGTPACGDGTLWTVPGGAITKKDNINNYPFHLR